MKRTYTNAIKKLKDLEYYLEFIDKSEELITYTPARSDSRTLKLLNKNVNDILTHFNTKRVFEYNATIISLYGILESFIENIILSYIEIINSIIKSYPDLPTTIIENHFELSAQLIKNLQRAKYIRKTEKEDIIINLHSCITNTSYKLNAYAYIDHSSNFRHNSVSESLKNIGIDNLTNKLINNNRFRGFIKQKHGISDIARLENDQIFGPLDELAQRRNDVSHGVSVQIIDRNLLLKLSSFTENYITAIFSILQQELYYLLATHSNPLQLQNIITVIRSHIVCFNAASGSFMVGDHILCISNENTPQYKISKIHEIQVNNQSCIGISLVSSIDVAIRLDSTIRVKQNYDYFLLDKWTKSPLSRI